MLKDEVVEEVRKARQERAARWNFDLKAILTDARKRQAKSGRSPRAPAPEAAAAAANGVFHNRWALPSPPLEEACLSAAPQASRWRNRPGGG